MAKPRGKEHTTLTETAAEVVTVLKLIPGIKMIAPGEIRTTSKRGSGKRFITFVYTLAGAELLISGQSSQKVSIHTNDPQAVLETLKEAKKLREFTFKERERKPGI